MVNTGPGKGKTTAAMAVRLSSSGFLVSQVKPLPMGRISKFPRRLAASSSP